MTRRDRPLSAADQALVADVADQLAGAPARLDAVKTELDTAAAYRENALAEWRQAMTEWREGQERTAMRELAKSAMVLEPGDVLIVKVGPDVTYAEAHRIAGQLRSILAPARFMVLLADAELVIAKPDPTHDRQPDRG